MSVCLSATKTNNGTLEQKVCILSVLGQNRPVSTSCFHDNQINLLYKEWQAFNASVNNSVDVNLLYPNDIPISQKYYHMALQQLGNSCNCMYEKRWVVDNETVSSPFITYIQRQQTTMTILKMAFKPNLSRKTHMSKLDVSNILVRFVYWSSNIQVLYFGDLENLSDIKRMYMKQYNLVVIRQTKHWVCILVDTQNMTFEYYSPNSTSDVPIYQSETILGKFSSNLLQTSSLKFRYIDNTTTKTKKKILDSGLAVIVFIYMRIFENHNYEKTVTLLNNRLLEGYKTKLFFTTTTNKVKTSEYECRVAALYYLTILYYIKNMEKNIIHNIRSIAKLITSTGKQRNAITVKCNEIQSELDSRNILTTSFSTISAAVVSDSLYVTLKSFKDKSNRSGLVKQIYSQLMDSQETQVRQTLEFTFDFQIKHLYGPLLQTVPQKLLPFIEYTVVKKSTIALGVYLLRTIDEWIYRYAPRSQKCELLLYKYPNSSTVVKPFLSSHMTQTINNCIDTANRARLYISKNILTTPTSKNEDDLFCDNYIKNISKQLSDINNNPHKSNLFTIQPWNVPVSKSIAAKVSRGLTLNTVSDEILKKLTSNTVYTSMYFTFLIGFNYEDITIIIESVYQVILSLLSFAEYVITGTALWHVVCNEIKIFHELVKKNQSNIRIQFNNNDIPLTIETLLRTHYKNYSHIEAIQSDIKDSYHSIVQSAALSLQ